MSSHTTRIWNYWTGGTDHDLDPAAPVYPDVVTLVRQARRFLVRTVSYLAGEAGLWQFLDIGSGLPTVSDTHRVAQRIAPHSRVVYVDNASLVLGPARGAAVDTSQPGVTRHVHTGHRDPGQIISDARQTLNFDQPIAVLLMGVLGHTVELAQARSTVSELMGAVPLGSHLVVWDGTSPAGELISGALPYRLRTPTQLAGCFAGLPLVEPGLVPITRWRPEPVDDELPVVEALGGVARTL